MAIRMKHVYMNFDETNVFTNLNLDFCKGKPTAVMGPSGVGKTTLINMLCGFLTPDYGEIEGLSALKISVVFQEDRLLEHLCGLENILYVLKNPKQHVKAAKALLDEAGLLEDAYKLAKYYSGGMKRRLALCRALAADFDLLILDEPLKGLDAALKPKILQMIKTRTMGKTVIFITHDRAEAESLDCPIVEISPA